MNPPPPPSPQMPTVPEYHVGSMVAHHNRREVGESIALPQIEQKHFPHLSAMHSGLTSMAVSHKSTAQGHFLPTIYSEKTSAKVSSLAQLAMQYWLCVVRYFCWLCHHQQPHIPCNHAHFYQVVYSKSNSIISEQIKLCRFINLCFLVPPQHVLYPSAPKHPHAHHHHRQQVPSHLPTISKHPHIHHARTGAG